MKFVTKKQKNRYALYSLIGSVISINIVIGGILFMMIFEEGINRLRLDDFLAICFYLFLPTLLNLYLINYIFWQIRGYEIIEMSEKTLLIKKLGKIFKHNTVIPLYKIKKIEEQEYNPPRFGDSIWQNSFRIAEFTGEAGGRIKVTYNVKILGFNLKNVIELGQGLSEEEAHLYVQQMNEILSNKQ